MFLVSPSVILRPSSLMETTLKETALRSHKKSYSQCLMTQRSKTVTPMQPFNVTKTTVNSRNGKIITFFILLRQQNYR